jgi:hypothetical protein
MMRLPLTTATMTYGTDAVSFQDGHAIISIKLRYVPQEPGRARAAADGNPVDIEDLIADAEARTPDDPAVVVQRVVYGAARPTEQQRALFVASLSLLLNENLGAFSHIFTWLKPTYTSYAYVQGVDDASSYLAVLNQTEGRSPEGLTNQIGVSAIPPGMDASILISNKLFMRQFVLPGMTRAFTHANADSFQLSHLDQTVENTERVRMDPFRVGAIDYTPYMDEFRLQTVGDQIQINSKISINISPGIDAYVSATYTYVIGLTTKDDGSATLDWEPVGEPQVTSWYTVALWVTLTVAMAGIILAVLGAAVTEPIKNVTIKIVVIALITVVVGILAATPQTIADVITNGAAAAMPAIGPMIDEAADPVDWPKSSGFTLKSAELNGSFQIGGLLSIAGATA